MTARERVLVVGASGFGRETLDVVEAMVANGHPIESIGVLDDRPSEANLCRLQDRDIRYLGTVDNWLLTGDRQVGFLVGIGDPHVRRAIAERLELAGFRAAIAVHPSVTIGSRTRIEGGVVVCAGAAISTNARLGQHVHVNAHATIGHDAVLGSFVSVNPAATISGEVTVGPGTLVGAGATILQNLAVGGGSVIGAGAVVTKDVSPGVLVVGVPAVVRRRLSGAPSTVPPDEVKA